MSFDPFSAFLDDSGTPEAPAPGPEPSLTKFSSEMRVPADQLESSIDLVELSSEILEQQVRAHQDAQAAAIMDQNVPLEAIWGQDPEGPMFPPNPEPEGPPDIALDEDLVAEVFRPRDVPEGFQPLTQGPEDAFPVEFDADIDLVEGPPRTSPNEAARFQVGRTDPPRRPFGRQIQHQDGVEVSRRVANSFQALNRPVPTGASFGAPNVVARRNPRTGQFETTDASPRVPPAQPSRPQTVTARAEVKTNATPPSTLLERVAGPDWF